MKKLFTLMAAALLLGNVGCNTESTPGGPGATRPSDQPALTQGDNTFTLDVPNTEVDLKQGETKTITLGIDRGKNFGQDVKLKFSGAPKGVKVTAMDSEIKADAKNTQVTIEADKEAALGEHTITVTGTPAKEGPPATSKFQIQISEPK